MGWMFRSGDSNEPMMWWTKGWHWCSPTVRCRSVIMAIFPECIFCDVDHHWDVRLEGLQDSIVKSAPSVWTAPQSFLYSLRTNRFLFFRIWKHAVCAKDLEALLLLRCHCHNKNAFFFLKESWRWKHTGQIHLQWIKSKEGSPLHPLVCEELSYIRGELWNGEVQTAKRRTSFWMTKALKAKTSLFDLSLQTLQASLWLW